jgi:hypothetical protein
VEVRAATNNPHNKGNLVDALYGGVRRHRKYRHCQTGAATSFVNLSPANQTAVNVGTTARVKRTVVPYNNGHRGTHLGRASGQWQTVISPINSGGDIVKDGKRSSEDSRMADITPHLGVFSSHQRTLGRRAPIFCSRTVMRTSRVRNRTPRPPSPLVLPSPMSSTPIFSRA